MELIINGKKVQTGKALKVASLLTKGTLTIVGTTLADTSKLLSNIVKEINK